MCNPVLYNLYTVQTYIVCSKIHYRRVQYCIILITKYCTVWILTNMYTNTRWYKNGTKLGWLLMALKKANQQHYDIILPLHYTLLLTFGASFTTVTLVAFATPSIMVLLTFLISLPCISYNWVFWVGLGGTECERGWLRVLMAFVNDYTMWCTNIMSNPAILPIYLYKNGHVDGKSIWLITIESLRDKVR